MKENVPRWEFKTAPPYAPLRPAAGVVATPRRSGGGGGGRQFAGGVSTEILYANFPIRRNPGPL